MSRYFLFELAEWKLALPLQQVRQIVDVSRMSIPAAEDSKEKIAVGRETLNLLDTCILPLEHPDGQKAEALAVVEEKGLTGAIFIDRIAGIREGSEVSKYPVPRRLSFCCSDFDGFIEDKECLYLLVNVGKAVGARCAGTGDAASEIGFEAGP